MNVKRATQILSSKAMASIVCAAVLLAAEARAGSQVTASKAALSTISPQATQAGLNVLKKGGNAIDAAVAVAFALAVTHPQAGNLGGGGFLTYYEAKTKGVWTLDFREVAPLAAKRDMYLQADGSIDKASRTGPLASAVPGTPAGLAAMHQRFGSKPWKELLVPAIQLARDGFMTDADLARDLTDEQKKRNIDQYISTASLFYPEGHPLRAGSKLLQPDLATTLERLGEYGAADFYDGETADKLVRAVRAGGGLLSYRDLKDYKPVWRAPIRIDFRNYSLYTTAPPSGGGLILGEALNILSGFDLEAAGFQTAKSIHLETEAMRRAYIDRNRYLGDPAVVRIPYSELLSAERARQWRTSLNVNKSTPTVTLGEPGSLSPEGNHTTHFTIADSEGNVVAITYTLNDNFGCGFVVPGLGFFMNDEMDDFTTAPGKANIYGLIQSNANIIAPGKRMASSMAPTIILRDGKPWLALGTRGGATIPTTILQVFLNMAVYKKTLQEAIAAPRYHQQGYPEEVAYERGLAPRSTVDALISIGHPVEERDPFGDVHAILLDKGKILAVADPRHGGSAGGF
jgi:gamma-glutamyltranspeptidase/glutathione hydrolase